MKNKNPFGSYWHEKYEIFWCNLCETWSIKCPECGNSSCNGGGCPQCEKDFEDFHKLLNNSWGNIFSQEELNTIEKYDRFNHLVEICLKNNREPVDWKWLKETEKICKLDEQIFGKYLK